MTADNTFECWINGQRAGSGENFQQGYAGWTSASLFHSTAENLIAVAAGEYVGHDRTRPGWWAAFWIVKY